VLKAHNIDSLIATGTLTNMCCETTARDAMMLDYKVVMVSMPTERVIRKTTLLD
jgi:ureidoacrylate peracid hydrolase